MNSILSKALGRGKNESAARRPVARTATFRTLTTLSALAVAFAACGSEEPAANEGTGGSSVTGGSAGTGTGAGAMNGGASGSTNQGGTDPGAGTGAGGAGTGAGAMAGAAGAGPSGGTGGSSGAGAGGSAGSGIAGAGQAGAGSGDSFVSDVRVMVHAEVNTILVVTWNQTTAAEQTFLEFTFENGEIRHSRAKPGTAGAHRDVVLGVPGSTAVTVRIVSRQAGVDHKTSDHQGMTGAVPSGFPASTVMNYDATLASPERYMLGSVEDSQGGCGPSCYNRWTYWTYIMDRQGRIVWYYSDPASNATSSYQRVARDGEYIWIEKRPYGQPGPRAVLKMTLDWEYYEQIDVPNLADCIDVTTDGSLLYNVDGTSPWLRERTRAGTTRDIWSCREQFGQGFSCYSNTVNWNEEDNTIFMSFPEENTVVEIDRVSGDMVASYGDAPGSYTFSPSSWGFEFQHFPNVSPSGTLMVSSHMPGNSDTYTPVAGQHAFIEFEINRTNRQLVERWVYNGIGRSEGQEWAMYKGMAIRLANGNTLANYGSGGVIREITPDKQTVFYVKFDAPSGDDFYNKMVGHNVLVDDLYALNGGGPQ